MLESGSFEISTLILRCEGFDKKNHYLFSRHVSVHTPLCPQHAHVEIDVSRICAVCVYRIVHTKHVKQYLQLEWYRASTFWNICIFVSVQQFPFTLRPLCPQHTLSFYFFICHPYWKTASFLHCYECFLEAYQKILMSNQYSLRKSKKANIMKAVMSATVRYVRNILWRNSFIWLSYHSLCGLTLLGSLTVNKVHKIMIDSSNSTVNFSEYTHISVADVTLYE